MRFEWHTKKAERNLKNHGVSFEDAATVFEDPFAEFLPDLQHSEEEARYICLGASAAGRLLAVSFTERGDDIRIISAREMEPKERRSYEKGNPFA
ncbi:MAG TPA: BrnT family toxin [Blastocatellia bacterium]|nr:BrnT family toxin [Blastocatellia bacterium]